jgi:hypothetical protein
MTTRPVERDERTVATENASYRWAYLVLSFGLLLAVAYRSFVLREPAWDLLALVIVGGAVATFYQGSHQVLTRRWVVASVAGALLAAVVAALVVRHG